MKEFWLASRTDVRWEGASLGGPRRLEALLKLRREFDPAMTRSTWEQAGGIKVVTLLDDSYPTNLKTIFDPPPVLYYRGGIC